MDFNDLKVFIMFVSNRVNGDKFVEYMMPRYNDKNYIENLWISFRDNPAMFIVSRREIELFEAIQNEIKTTNYNG